MLLRPCCVEIIALGSAFRTNTVGNKIKIIGLIARWKGGRAYEYTVYTYRFLASDAMKMQVFVVVFVFVALVVAQGIFHAATVVGHLV